MGFGKNIAEESTKGRINAMPSYIGGRFDIAGIKWIGSNPLNLQKGLPRASALTVLNDPDTKFPVCIMNGAEISAVRTGASSGVAAKYLARKKAETLLLVGAGYQNQMQLEAIYAACPSLKYFYVVDIVPEVAQRFAETMEEKLNITITPLTSYDQCDRIPDITVNATSAPVPVMDIAAAHAGGLHICVGGLDHPELYKKADKIVCDSWYQVRHRPVCYMAQDALAGRFDETKIYANEIGQIICGEKPGRETEEEFCYYKPVGMGVLDLAIAVRLYRQAREEGKGIWLPY
jgi:ornithine cyclodeaminase